MVTTFRAPIPNHRTKHLNFIPTPKNPTNQKEAHEHRDDAHDDPK